jgi:hypothetical protein
VGSVISGVGNSSFYPSNNSEVMTAAPPGAYGVTSGLLRMFTTIGTVCSFAISLLVVSLSIPRQDAFTIFLGVHVLDPAHFGSFVAGMHAVLYVAAAFVAVALVLSVFRGRRHGPGLGDPPTARGPPQPAASRRS